MTMVDARPQLTQLPLRELVPVMATNVCSDPGPDPTWYPGGWPPEKEPEEEPKPIKSITGRVAKSARKGVIPDVVHCSYGCSTDRSTMCNAGLITGVASALGLYLSIDLLLRSSPRVYVGPAQASPYATGNTVGLAGRS
jgi:hypothetical protein